MEFNERADENLVLRPSRGSVVIGVLLIVTLVMVPFLRAYWPIERARWLVAAAENAVLLNKTKDPAIDRRAEELMSQAKLSYQPIEYTIDFARTSFLLEPKNVDRAIRLVKSLDVEKRPRFAEFLANRLATQNDFRGALQVLKSGYPERGKRTHEQQNSFAYNAALADQDLEEALGEIEEALAASPNAALFDTYAWVLYRLNRFQDALVAIDQALAKLPEVLESSLLSRSARQTIKEYELGTGKFEEVSGEAFKKELELLEPPVQEYLQTLAVLRYHRGEILISLGKLEEADREFEWLTHRGFEDFDNLF